MDERDPEKTCNHFQIALEKKAAGALSEGETAELEAHLGGCSECQRVRELIESLRSMEVPKRTSPSLEVVHARLAHRRRFYWSMVGLYVVLTVCAFVVFGPKLGLLHIAAGALGVGVTTYRYRKLNELAAGYAESRNEIFEEFRKEVRGHLQFLENKAFLVMPVVLALSGAQDIHQGRALMGGYYLVLAACIAAVWLRGRLVHRPRLRRELEELRGGDVDA